MARSTCSINGCGKPAHGRGWCSMHYARNLRFGDTGPVDRLPTRRAAPPCAVDGCGRVSRKRGFCNSHFARWKKHGDPGPAAFRKKADDYTGWVDK